MVGFCEYSTVNMIIDQLKHSDGREENKTVECLERVIGDQSWSVACLGWPNMFGKRPNRQK